MRTLLVSALLIALSSGCGPSFGTDSDDPNDPGDDGSDNGNGGGGGDEPLIASVYAHSWNELYRIDPETLEVSLVGPFKWPNFSDQMTDIAIDKDGNMTGVSYESIYSVNKDTAECTFLADISSIAPRADLTFNGLSWVPANSPDPNAPEILVATSLTGEVFQIDPLDGDTTVIGNYQGGWYSSGDLVAVKGFGILATVTNDSENDYLARIDPTTWRAEIIGPTGYSSIWGLGFWKNQVYGFTDDQEFVLIDPATGDASPVESSAVKWWGAGVTTRAPIIE